MLRFVRSFKIHNFVPRHIGINKQQQSHMLNKLDCKSIDQLMDRAIPNVIKTKSPLNAQPLTENEALDELFNKIEANKVFKSYIGMGYHNTITPNVIKRNLLENPMWYTQYTPYQAEISQGRLESLINYQTMVCELTGLDVSNASLLDEPTAAAEAMQMMLNITNKHTLIVDQHVHAHTIELLKSRAEPLNIKIVISTDLQRDIAASSDLMGIVLQSPNTLGIINDFSKSIAQCHAKQGLVAMGADLLSLMKINSPGANDADISFGNAQRFGVPFGYGGPHAAFFATKSKYIRKMPGRIVGVSKDVDGNLCYRLTLQTREQHIKRERATSNICTSQALLANISAMYAVYHGKEGLVNLAETLYEKTKILHDAISKSYKIVPGAYFDTISFYHHDLGKLKKASELAGVNFRLINNICTIALDETITDKDLTAIATILDVKLTFGNSLDAGDINSLSASNNTVAHHPFQRTGTFLEQPIFQYKSETEMLRYLYKLQKKDLSLADAMIPLGSCTMKLNATSEMIPITHPKINNIHPFAPSNQTRGYKIILNDLEQQLNEITGMDACSLQPNSGAQGEYAGLRTIREYFNAKNQVRNIALIPTSAHGTNPASAVMSGYKVVPVKCLDDGYLDIQDLALKIKENGKNIAVMMITYPSTFGVFDDNIKQVIEMVHNVGAQVYLDGANLNAQVGLCKPGEYGADVCHLNLHKTFCIPHGGGGPGMGPICVKSHLKQYLPRHLHNKTAESNMISGAPYGSASILPITWMYIKMMGGEGLKYASEIAILNANYMAHALRNDYKVLYSNKNGKCAHEFIIDARPFEPHVTATDIAKRLLDYGFHAPTMSWPVTNTLMIEPTESEPFSEIERFVKALKMIRQEIEEIKISGEKDNVLKNAPHTMEMVARAWTKPYDRVKAVYPAGKIDKFWPTVRRVDDGYGDKNLICTCPSVEDFSK